MRKYSWVILLLSFVAFAQSDETKTSVEDFFYSSGKIYVVIAILVIIFIGIMLYLVRLDRKITKLEKQNEA